MPSDMAEETNPQEKKQSSYTFEDAMMIADDIFKMQKEKEYHPGAFIHGLVITLEATQQTYNVPPQQMAEVKRSARRYIQEINELMASEQKENK